MNPSKPGVLVPPRPNLGPEPWDEPDSWRAYLPALGVVFALVIVVTFAAWRMRRVRARGRHALPGPIRVPHRSAAPRRVESN